MNDHNTDNTTQDLIERICEQGCTVVRQHIEILIHQEKNIAVSLPRVLAQTSKAQQKRILDELMAIMAIYDNKDCDENKF